MGKYMREFTEELITFIGEQKIFFVATAPSDEGRINLSPKGYESLALMNTHQLVYLDYAGSGNETANHVQENGKITIMWNSFNSTPLILRAYGKGKVVAKNSEQYLSWMQQFFPEVDPTTARQLIAIDVESIQTSCGYGVPIMEFASERSTLSRWAEKKAVEGTLDQYIEQNASRSETKFPLI